MQGSNRVRTSGGENLRASWMAARVADRRQT